MIKHSATDLVELFNGCFKASYQCILVAGAKEPVYLPASASNKYNEIHFAHDYFASALHEIAHWTIAGSKRRQLVDYGYWYVEDGRDQAQQAAFEAVEVYPQAIEAIFAEACDYPFQVSVDNLSAVPDNADNDYWLALEREKQQFAQAVYQQQQTYLAKGLPKDAVRFKQALENFYQGSHQKTA